MKYNKKTGETVDCDGGKDDDGREDDFFEVEEATGEQFMSVRPWLGQIIEPDEHNPVNPDKPSVQYDLEYVYGYRCADSKQNVYWNNAGSAVYMTAALGVILDPQSNTQKFFGGGEVDNTAKNVANDQAHHTDDVMCIRVDNARTTAVSGQVGSKPTIFTWDACTGEKKQRIKIAKGARGIKACAINDDGWVAAVDLHNEHQVYVFDNQGNQVLKQKGDTNMIHDVCWDNKPGSKRFSTAGKKHMYFWDASDATGDKKKGIFGSNEQTSFSGTAWDSNGLCYSGGSNGKIYVWGGDGGRMCEKTIDGLHKGFVCAIRFAEGKLWTGAKDGKVHCIDTTTHQSTRCIEVGSLVRAIDCMGDKLLIGQRDGTITCMQGDNKMEIMHSHDNGEVWGLAQTSSGTIVTSGDDNKVMMWDPESRKMTKCSKVTDRSEKSRRGRASTMSRMPDSKCSRAVAINDSFIAIAGNDGAVTVRAVGQPDMDIKTMKDSTEWIEVMSFSPDGAYLAVGSHDNATYVYRTSDWGLQSKCNKHSSYIMALDWCCESKTLRTNCGAYELLFFTAASGEQDPSGRSNYKNTAWATTTCKFLWQTEGIYPSGCDGTHINSVCGSNDKQILATGDDYGLVNIFNDPCRKGGIPRCYRGHSEHVVRVMFGAGDQRLFSVGGYDQTLMQWKKC